MGYDPVQVSAFTADSINASNGLISTHGRILVHALSVECHDGGNSVDAGLYEAATVTGTPKEVVITSANGDGTTFDRYKKVEFNPPILFENLFTVDVNGTSNVTRVHWTIG